MSRVPPLAAVVNDDPVQLRLVERLLEKEGLATSGYLDAADLLEDLDPERPPDLVVADLHMPGIDGWKLCRILRSRERAPFDDVPILVTSATFAGEDVEEMSRDLGADAFLPFPFRPEELRRHVDGLLAGDRPRPERVALVVDADEGARTEWAEAFRGAGYRVLEAATGEACLARAGERTPDVVLLDVRLPDAEGPDLIPRIRAPGDRTVVLVVTGDDDPHLPVEVLRRGADAFARKPVEPDYLLGLARRATRQRALLRVEEVLERRTRELRASDRRFETLFSTIPDLVIVLDDAGRVRSANEVACRRLGRPRSEIQDLPLSGLVDPERRGDVNEGVTGAVTLGQGAFDVPLVAADGEVVETEARARTVRDGGDDALLLVLRDVTERRRSEEHRKRLEVRMQHAQRLESLGVLAGGIAHDFNNLLVGILGNAGLALLDLPHGDPVRDGVEQIEMAARRAAELTAQILTFSGKGTVPDGEVDLADMARETLRLVEPVISRRARVSWEVPEELPPVQGDPAQLRQVVMNLILNASDALEGEPGVITVAGGVETVSADPPGSWSGAPPRPGRYARLEVADTGCGMDADTAQRIFEPFFTTKFAGRGLGLAAVLGILRSHGGAARVESEPGSGSRFTVLLPLSSAGGRSPAADAVPGATLHGRGGTVLVADDEAAVRALARAVLVRAGYRVRLAADGREALDLFHSDPRAFDVLLVDLTMPVTGGLEVLEGVRAVRPDVPVLLSSGYARDSAVGVPDDRPGVGFLAKPYSPDQLLRALAALLPLSGVREDVG